MSIRKILNPMIHLFITLAFIFLLLNGTLTFTTVSIVVYWCLSIAINAVTFVLSFIEAKWRNYFSSIAGYILLIIIFIAFKVTFGDPSEEVDENIGAGLAALVVFILSLTTIAIGNLIGIIIKMNFNKKFLNNQKM